MMNKNIEFDGTQYKVEAFVQGLVKIENLSKERRLTIPAADLIDILESYERTRKPFSKKYECIVNGKASYLEINVDKFTREGLTIVNLVITDNKHDTEFVSDTLCMIDVENILEVAAVSISQNNIRIMYDVYKESAN